MKTKFSLFLLIVLCFSLLGEKPQVVRALQPLARSNPEKPFVPGEVIVGLPTGQRAAQYKSQAQALAGQVNAQVAKISDNTVLFRFDESVDVLAQAEQMAAMSGVTYAEPNYIFSIPEPNPGDGTPGDIEDTPVPLPNNKNEAVSVKDLQRQKPPSSAILPPYPNDQSLGNSWGWWNTNSDVVWQDMAAGAMICSLDSGVDGGHPELAGMVVNGKDVVNLDSVADDDKGHGTHVAGIMAAKSNNTNGIPGMSRSKILAVKILNSQGSGNSFDIAEGIKFCANNTSVKVLNMSWGSYAASFTIYNALDYAINTKGKLAVAAAGNASYPDFMFPAAWAADFACNDGSSTYPSSCYPYNTISHGLISVGAGRSNWSSAYDTNQDGYLWVDTDGDGARDPGEDYSMLQCAAYFSNYGPWVQIVAPGEDILSTVPVSYPFNDQYRYDVDADGDGYDYSSGTSMAAPFVSGVAARLFSAGSAVFGTTAVNNTNVKNRLLFTGTPLTLAVDPHTDLYWGYDSTSGNPSATGYFRGEAPYCWPNNSQGGEYGMSNTVYLDAAAAMNRATLFAFISNAINGLPLTGAVISAYQGTAVKNQVLLASKTSNLVVMPNLRRGDTYDVKVNMVGFTSGAVTVSRVTLDSSYGYQTGASLAVSIPPTGKITGVVDWTVPTGLTDMDLYAWTPNVSGIGWVVGYYGMISNQPYLGPGTLVTLPYARWNRDGGFSDGTFDFSKEESITILPRPGYSTTPYYNLTKNDFYDFLLTDYGNGALNANDIYFRVWVGGKIIATVQKSAICNTAGGETWWEPGFFQLNKFYAWDKCGTSATYAGGGIWPYSGMDSAFTAQGLVPTQRLKK
jgi:subtilisin family serine protease